MDSPYKGFSAFQVVAKDQSENDIYLLLSDPFAIVFNHKLTRAIQNLEKVRETTVETQPRSSGILVVY